jgi:divalent metal cation (Fe/Co/Zn/Cd) transporter
VSPSTDHQSSLRQGRRLQFATIAWNAMEVVVTIGLGVVAGSLALIAFGLDSLVEVFASLVVVWYIADHAAEGRVTRALRLVGLAFALLGGYLLVASAYSLITREVADSSPIGILYLGVTAVVMFSLARVKRRVAKVARSEPLAAEASMTFLDGWLATGILLALALNAGVGLWWADPAAAALVAFFCFREAAENWIEARHLSTRTGATGDEHLSAG